MQKMIMKPFNPLLGETYEYMAPNFNFFSEQVSHHPPITAYICEGKTGYKYWSINNTKSKFTGKGITFNQLGKYYYELKTPDSEIYECEKPQLFACNLIIGTEYVDIGGKVDMNCAKTGMKAQIEFSRRGWKEKTHNIVDAKIIDRAGV